MRSGRLSNVFQINDAEIKTYHSSNGRATVRGIGINLWVKVLGSTSLDNFNQASLQLRSVRPTPNESPYPSLESRSHVDELRSKEALVIRVLEIGVSASA